MGESRHKERRSTVVVNESSSRSFLAFRPRGHRTKAPGCWPGPLRPETYPSLVSDPRASDGGKKGEKEGRKKETERPVLCLSLIYLPELIVP